MNKRILSLLGTTMAFNIVLFQLYRAVFLAAFGPHAGMPETAQVLWSGLRLDLALLGFEFSLLGFVFLVLRRVRPSRLLMALWALTGLHILVGVANCSTFAERNQNFGELLLPYLSSPYQVYLAVMPFCLEHWLWMIALAASLAAYFWVGLRLSRKLGAAPLEWWCNRRTFAMATMAAFLPLVLALQPVLEKRGGARVKKAGWRIKVSDSRFFARFPDHARNQAVLNPLFEFLGSQAPAHLFHRTRYRMSEEDALATWRQLVGHPPADPNFPLLKTIHGHPRSPVENVIIIQVEGLSGSLLEQERDGRVVTPFLRRIAAEGLYFTNVFQNANFTSGGVFSTMASVPKLTFEQASSRFASFEMEGRYSSLARVLGAKGATHFFCEGFRQSWDDFMAFTSRQGCVARGYRDFADALERKGRLAGADTLLGISDGAFLDECAELFLACTNRFTAHCMTCTSHSPWAVPADFPTAFREAPLNAFAYFDAMLARFCERLQSVPALWQKTMVVVIGDHTSVTFGQGELERLRLPLIFYGPGVLKVSQPDPRPASQVDVLPTVLGLMRGEHPYAGLGRNLLDLSSPATGVIGGRTDQGWFLKDGYMLDFLPASGEVRLRQIIRDTLSGEDCSTQQPDIAQRLRQEYFSQIELVRRLAVSQRIFPAAPPKLAPEGP